MTKKQLVKLLDALAGDPEVLFGVFTDTDVGPNGINGFHEDNNGRIILTHKPDGVTRAILDDDQDYILDSLLGKNGQAENNRASVTVYTVEIGPFGGPILVKDQ